MIIFILKQFRGLFLSREKEGIHSERPLIQMEDNNNTIFKYFHYMLHFSVSGPQFKEKIPQPFIENKKIKLVSN